jgi:uncharacterized membrane protein
MMTDVQKRIIFASALHVVAISLLLVGVLLNPSRQVLNLGVLGIVLLTIMWGFSVLIISKGRI